MAQEQTKDSEQGLENLSFDPTFGVSTVELIGFDLTNNVLRRVAVDDTGLVRVILV